jgi:hypothetical protein
VIKFFSEKSFLVEKKTKKSPPLGQTLGFGHFEETPPSLGGGGGFVVKKTTKLKKIEIEK